MKPKATGRVPEVIGWREWIGLPDFGIAAMRAKINIQTAFSRDLTNRAVP